MTTITIHDTNMPLEVVLAHLEENGVPIKRFTEVHDETSGIIFVVTEITPATYELQALHEDTVGTRSVSRLLM